MSADLRATPIPLAALALGLAGVAPFAVSAIVAWHPSAEFSSTEALRLGLIYGALILSFLGGIRWGTALGPIGARRQAAEFTASIVPTLVALTALWLPQVLGLSLLVVGFLVMALWDVMTVERGRLPQWFGRLRMILTSGAVLSQLAMLAAVLI